MKLAVPFFMIAALIFSTLAYAESSAPIEPAPPGQTSTTTTTTGTVQPGVTTSSTHITQSDDLAMGDPLGNSGMTPRANAGPPNTHNLCQEGSTEEDCVRAAKRHNSPTTWQQDCASGLSKSCGYR